MKRKRGGSKEALFRHEVAAKLHFLVATRLRLERLGCELVGNPLGFLHLHLVAHSAWQQCRHPLKGSYRGEVAGKQKGTPSLSPRQFLFASASDK